MLKVAFLIASKDIRLVMARGGAWAQPLLLGLLLVFVFSLSVPTGETPSPQTAATLFWLASAFCLVLAFSMLYALEDPTEARCGLILAPVPVQSVWLGKLIAGFVSVLLAQIIFFPALLVFLNQQCSGDIAFFILGTLIVDVGMSGLGALLGASASGQAARESLMSVIVFPLLVPVLLAGIRICEAVFAVSGNASDDMFRWLGLACAYDAVFLGASFLLFPYVFGDTR